MSSDSYKGNRSTQRRVDDRSQRYSPAQDPLRELDDRLERDAQPAAGSFEEFQARVMRSWNADLRRLAMYRQAALEIQATIRDGLSWIDMGAEPSVAHSSMRKAIDHWRPILGELEEQKSSAPRASKAPTSSTGDTDGRSTRKESPKG